MPDIPDLTAELDDPEASARGDDATCRYCGGLIVPCTEPIRYCKGWKHAAYLHYGPVGPHYCEGRSINPMAEPGGSP